jgi:hypothetical protein
VAQRARTTAYVAGEVGVACGEGGCLLAQGAYEAELVKGLGAQGVDDAAHVGHGAFELAAAWSRDVPGDVS